MAVNPNSASLLAPLKTPFFLGQPSNSGMPAIDAANKGQVNPSSFIMSPPWQNFFNNLWTAVGQLQSVQATIPGQPNEIIFNVSGVLEGSSNLGWNNAGQEFEVTGAGIFTSVPSKNSIQGVCYGLIVEDASPGSVGLLFQVTGYNPNSTYLQIAGAGATVPGLISIGAPITTLSGPMTIEGQQGAGVTDGRIILQPTPGSSGAGQPYSSVFTQVAVSNQPGVTIVDYASGSGCSSYMLQMTNNSGTVEFGIYGGAATVPFGVLFGGQPIFTQHTTGSGSAALGSNCPASTVSAPYEWIKIQDSSGNQLYVPAWK